MFDILNIFMKRKCIIQIHTFYIIVHCLCAICRSTLNLNDYNFSMGQGLGWGHSVLLMQTVNSAITYFVRPNESQDIIIDILVVERIYWLSFLRILYLAIEILKWDSLEFNVMCNVINYLIFPISPALIVSIR